MNNIVVSTFNFFVILVTTTFLFFIPAAWADVSVSDGLLAHYPFDGNTKDVSGNEFHQIISGNNGAVFLTEDRLGAFDSAYEFGETLGVIVASNGTSNMFKPFLNGLTVSFWAYPSVKANLNKYGFFSIGYPGNTGVGGLQFGYEGRNDDSHHDFFLAGAQRTEDIPKVVEINKWQHFTITITPGAAATETLTSTFATSDIIFYKNGVRIKKTSYYALSIYQRPGSRLHIGWISCCGGYKGKLDDLRIYDRVLSDAEISRIPGDIPSPTEDEVSSNPPPILSLTPSDSGSSNIVHLECNQPIDINLDHAEGKWNLNFNGKITQREINLEKNYHVSDCGAKWVIHLEDPNDRNVKSNTIEIVWENKVQPPKLSLSRSNAGSPNTVHLYCNEPVDIIPSHTKGKWNVSFNGEIAQKELKLGLKYTVPSCGDHWKIHLEHPNDSSLKSNTIEIIWDTKRLLKTYWDQYRIYYDVGSTGNLTPYVPGCTAVAVGQLINYYFEKGYRNGWLESLLENTTAYPRVKINREDNDYKIVVSPNLSFVTKDQYKPFIKKKPDDNGINFNYLYDEPDDDDLVDFLTTVAIGLDSQFNIDKNGNFGTGGGTIYGNEYYDWVDSIPEKIRTLLIDRFRFSEDIEASELLSSMNQEKDYIIESIDKNQPVLMGMSGGVFSTKTNEQIDVSGHLVIVDSYRESQEGVFEVRINFGWGRTHPATQKWYLANTPVEPPWRTNAILRYDGFYFFKNTVPINYNENK